MAPAYRLRLVLPDVCFGLCEAGAVLWPIHVFFTASRRLLLGTGLLFLLCTLVWAMLLNRWLDRLGANLTSREACLLPWRSLWARVALVLGGAALLGVFAVQRLGYPPQALVVAVWSAAIYTPLIDSFRALLWHALLRDALLPHGATEAQELSYLSATLGGQLTLVALGTGAPAMATVLAVARFFVPLSPSQSLYLQVFYPPVPIALLLLWGMWMARTVRPFRRYLRARTLTPGARPIYPIRPIRPIRPARAEKAALPEANGAARLYHAAQLLPYILGLSKVVLWSLASLSWWILGTRLWGIDSESNLLLFGLTVLVTLGAALYEVLWHRATLAPLLTHLSGALHGTPPVRAPLSLRSKMLLSFGALTIFACGLSLFWSAIQYRSVAVRYARWLNRGRLDDLSAELRAAAAPTPATVVQHLQRHAGDRATVYYLAPDRRRFRFGPAGTDPPELPREAWNALSRRERGDLDLPAQALSASYAPLVGPAPGAGAIGADLGAALVAHPTGQDAALNTEAGILIVFFVLLLSGSIGVVVLTAADLTRPLRELEHRADSVRRGELLKPGAGVIVEGDEVGRLYEAFEEMRRALSERFRSSTEVHFALEAQVARRTAELERRNRELQEALSALRRAQTELLAAEKMASMGRLVAGIAHEINNPVNAVVNTAGPMAESLGELQELLSGAAPDGELQGALRGSIEDMRDMLRVVQRGARRTKEIVQALHHYSRGDGGQAAPVDLHRCLDDSLDLLHHYLKQGITVRKDYGTLPPALGYGGQLQQVFMNLLTNAAQALGAPRPAGAPAPEICITTRPEDRAPRRLLVRIADNGPGIPPDVLPRIFDPFYTTKDVGQGSGLGLSIVHSIVERHGGAIAVETAVGQGTAFVVSLPVSGLSGG